MIFATQIGDPFAAWQEPHPADCASSRSSGSLSLSFTTRTLTLISQHSPPLATTLPVFYSPLASRQPPLRLPLWPATTLRLDPMAAHHSRGPYPSPPRSLSASHRQPANPHLMEVEGRMRMLQLSLSPEQSPSLIGLDRQIGVQPSPVNAGGISSVPSPGLTRVPQQVNKGEMECGCTPVGSSMGWNHNNDIPFPVCVPHLVCLTPSR